MTAYRGKLHVAVMGGIGDVILSYALLDALERRYGRFRFYTNQPDTYRFYSEREADGDCADFVKLDQSDAPTCLVGIDTFSLVINRSKDARFQKLLDLNTKFIVEHQLQSYVEDRPFKDGIAADFMGGKGFTRSSLSAAMLGFHDLRFVRRRPKPLRTWLRRYVTIHDGFGTYHADNGATGCTKTWPRERWEELVGLLKAKYPDHAIVQLGHPSTARHVPGVDHSFIGTFSIADTFRILAHSKLHIDGDSGLTHAATSFGVPTVALFGPTPGGYFGYPQNVNLQSNACRPCYWSNDTWLERCPRGFRAPICMTTITPYQVLAGAEALIG